MDFSIPKIRIASRIRKQPIPSEFAMYSGMSNDTEAWFCAMNLMSVASKETRLEDHHDITLVSSHGKSMWYRINGVPVAVSNRLRLTREVVDNIGGRAIIIESQRCRVVGC